MGAAADDKRLSFMKYPDIPPETFKIVENVFFLCFFIELFLRAFALRKRFLTDFWSWLDLIAIVPTLFDLLLNDDGMKRFVLFRFMRVIRLMRLFRLIRLCKGLYLIVQGFVNSIGALFWVTVLLGIALYTSSIYLTTLVGHNVEYDMMYEPGYFDRTRLYGSIARTQLSLFQILTLDSWTSIVRPIVEGPQPYLMFYFVSFIFVSTFGLLNVLIGVLADNVMRVSEKDQEISERLMQEDIRSALVRLEDFFAEVDRDGNGFVTAEELRAWFDRQVANDAILDAVAKLEDFDIQEADELIAIVEAMTEGEKGLGVGFSEFILFAQRLRGEARSKDMMATFAVMRRCMLLLRELRAGRSTMASDDRRRSDVVPSSRHCGATTAGHVGERMTTASGKATTAHTMEHLVDAVVVRLDMIHRQQVREVLDSAPPAPVAAG